MTKKKADAYVRLSRDEDKENYSSIESQIQIIKDICIDNDFELGEIIIDDNVSGYHFDRPGLNKLKERIENKLVDVLIAKDLSRIGRHNALTLLFLEYLEDNNVRLMVGGYDSDKDTGDIIGIETWYNERYIKDISKKITDNLRSKQKTNGLVVKETYGYIKDVNDHQKLLVDEIAARTIKRIYKTYIEGNGYRKVADILNTDNIPTPSKHINSTLNVTRPESKLWDSMRVKRVLENEIYIGTLISHKTKKKKMKGATVYLDKDEHFVHKNHHEAIINEDDFNLVQKIIKSRTSRNVRGTSRGINLYSGFLYCGDCGSPMFGYKRRDIMRYVCGNYHKHGKKMCDSHTVLEKDLNEIITKQIQELIDSITINIDNIDGNIIKNIGDKKNFDNLIIKLKTKLDEKSNEMKNYSKQFAKGLIGEDIFIELTSDVKGEIILIQETLNDTMELKDNLLLNKENVFKSMDILNEIINRQQIERRDLEKFLDKILVYQVNRNSQNGEHAIVKLQIELNYDFDSICYHNQEVVYTHWNDTIVGISTKLSRLLKEVI